MINPGNLEIRQKLLDATFGRLKRHKDDSNLSVQSMGDVIVATRFDSESVIYFNEQGESIKLASAFFDENYKPWYSVSQSHDTWKLYYRPEGSYHVPEASEGLLPESLLYTVKKLLSSRDVSLQQAGLAYRKAMGPEGVTRLDNLLGLKAGKQGLSFFGRKKENPAVGAAPLTNDF